MARFDINSLTYTPSCSWVVPKRNVYFNKNFLAVGEPVKVLVTSPRYELDASKSLSVDVFSIEENSRLLPPNIWGRKLQIVGPDCWGQIIETGRDSGLKPGFYRVDVVDFERRPGFAEEHQFYVASKETYWKQWQLLFGDEWDEAIYWDNMRVEQGKEILRGLPIDTLLFTLPEAFLDESDDFVHVLPALVTALMAHTQGGLPYSVHHRVSSSSDLPHIDFGKLIWLIRVLSIVWWDLAFFSSECEISVAVDQDGLTLEVNLSEFPESFHESDLLKGAEKFDNEPMLLKVVKELAGSQIKFDWKLEPRKFASLRVYPD